MAQFFFSVDVIYHCGGGKNGACDISLLFPSVAFMFVTIYWNADISFLVHTYPVLFSFAVAAIFFMSFQQNRRQKLQKCSSDTV